MEKPRISYGDEGCCSKASHHSGSSTSMADDNGELDPDMLQIFSSWFWDDRGASVVEGCRDGEDLCSMRVEIDLLTYLGTKTC